MITLYINSSKTGVGTLYELEWHDIQGDMFPDSDNVVLDKQEMQRLRDALSDALDIEDVNKSYVIADDTNS